MVSYTQSEWTLVGLKDRIEKNQKFPGWFCGAALHGQIETLNRTFILVEHPPRSFINLSSVLRLADSNCVAIYGVLVGPKLRRITNNVRLSVVEAVRGHFQFTEIVVKAAWLVLPGVDVR